MTKQEIINEIASNHVAEDIIMNVSRNSDTDSLHDLAQDIYIDLLSKSDEKIISMYEDGTLQFFIVRMITNNMFSSNSPYYRVYRDFSHRSDDLSSASNKASDE